MQFKGVNHIAIICSNYRLSKRFYTKVLGFTILAEHYREDKRSYKLDLALNGTYCIELFSFPDPPKRKSSPEARGLRHLALSVEDLDEAMQYLKQHKVKCVEPREDPYTGQRFTFFEDPDGLPLELFEIPHK